MISTIRLALYLTESILSSGCNYNDSKLNIYLQSFSSKCITTTKLCEFESQPCDLFRHVKCNISNASDNKSLFYLV